MCVGQAAHLFVSAAIDVLTGRVYVCVKQAEHVCVIAAIDGRVVCDDRALEKIESWFVVCARE